MERSRIQLVESFSNFVFLSQRKPFKATTSTRSRSSVQSESAEVYVTIADFKAQAGDGLDFKAGVNVEVITKNSSGWWYVQLGNEEGWVPSSYLEKAESSKQQQSMTRSGSHSQMPRKALTSARSQDNLDQIASASKVSSLGVGKQRTHTSGDKQAVKAMLSSQPVLQRKGSPSMGKKSLTHSTLKDRRSPPPVPSYKKHQETAAPPPVPSYKKHQKTAAVQQSSHPARPISPDAPLVKPRNAAAGDLNSVLKKKFESTETAKPASVISKQKSEQDGTDGGGKRKTPPARPTQGPQKKAGPARPPISPALKHKLLTNSASTTSPTAPSKNTTSPTKPEQWVTCENYSEVGDGCIAFTKGQTVELIDSSNNDWWYVKIGGKEGYAPANYLTKKETTTATVTAAPPPVVKKRSVPQVAARPSAVKPGPPKPVPRGAKKKMYRALADYHDNAGLSFREGDTLELIDDSDDWWFVKLDGVEGWAPSTYLELMFYD